jgi:LPPG:FO 2-phospho-L-lactate transferase
VLDALADAEISIGCPSNPLVSIGPLLSVPGMEDALIKRRDVVVAVSPIVGGAALKGPADRLLRELGHEPSALGVARLYAPWVGTLVVDDVDGDLAPAIERGGVRCVVTDTVMASRARAAALAEVVRSALR